MSAEVVPGACDVAIIGGGIVGVCTAYALARDGLSVVVFEKGQIGHEQSSRNWGWIRTLDRDLSELPLALRSIELWKQIQDETDVGFRQSGVLYVARHAQDMTGYESWHDQARQLGSDVTLLDSKQAMAMTPGSTRAWAGGMYGPTDGVAEPGVAAIKIAQLARARGAQIVQNCTVRSIERSGGKVSGLITNHGTVKVSRVLLAGGAWTRQFCSSLGVVFPQIRVSGSVLRTSALDAGVDVALNTRDFTCRKRRDGGYTVSRFRTSVHDIVPDSLRQMKYFLPAWWRSDVPVKLKLGKRFFVEAKNTIRQPSHTERFASFEPSVYASQMQKTFERLALTFPQFRNATVEQTWAGYMDVTPDALPVISPVANVPGMYVASGFSGHGFGIAPAVGEMAARMIHGDQTDVDLEPFSLARFTKQR